MTTRGFNTTSESVRELTSHELQVMGIAADTGFVHVAQIMHAVYNKVAAVLAPHPDAEPVAAQTVETVLGNALAYHFLQMDPPANLDEFMAGIREYIEARINDKRTDSPTGEVPSPTHPGPSKTQ